MACIYCLKRISNSDKSLRYEDGLRTKLTDCTSVTVHAGCRKCYTRPGFKTKTASKDELMFETPGLHPSMGQFDFKTDCLFCDEEASARVEKNKGPKFRREIYEVKTIEMRDRAIASTFEREDESGDFVLA